ncbi:MAG: hypothetical protein J6I61_03120 [Prevotella sp.]|nr:hypothetical protein [Prevotella sp.]
MQFVHDADDAHDIVHDAYEDVWRHFSAMEANTVRGFLYKNVYATKPSTCCAVRRHAATMRNSIRRCHHPMTRVPTCWNCRTASR